MNLILVITQCQWLVNINMKHLILQVFVVAKTFLSSFALFPWPTKTVYCKSVAIFEPVWTPVGTQWIGKIDLSIG
jgi:hypothetical protein